MSHKLDDSESSIMLEKALQIAIKAHAGQKRWNGDPYIFHPIRVSLSLVDPNEKIVALLHDVLEDSNLTEKDLFQEGFSNEIVVSVCLLTRCSHLPYENYIYNLKYNHIACAVKIADLKDNLDLLQVPNRWINERLLKRILKYKNALEFLQM